MSAATRRMANAGAALLVATTVLAPVAGLAQSAGGAQNDANNPLTPKITINLQDYFIPSLYGIPGQANQFLLRGLVPHDLFGAPQMLRFTLPLVTTPTGLDSSVTGIGDLTLMDLFMFPGKQVSFGIGPMLVAPTATDDLTGDGKWQAGAAAVAVAPQKWGLAGGLVTYQASFAGDEAREDVSLLTAQPILFYNLPEGFYLRSSAVWNFDLEAGDSYIPVGFGIGRAMPIGNGTTMNAYVEPQYTVFQEGSGAPQWQIFGGINFQFDSVSTDADKRP